MENISTTIKERAKDKNSLISKANDYIKPFNPIHISNLMSIKFPDNEWIVEKLVPSQGLIAVSGNPASFKTWLVLEMSIKIAKGEKLFGKFQTTQGGVLIIDEENGDRLLQKRFKKLHEEYDMPIYLLPLSGFILNEGSAKRIFDFAIKNDIKVIIFDALVRIHDADENSAKEMSKIFKILKVLTAKGLTIIFTHHHRKSGINRINSSQEMRGSSDIFAVLDSHISIKRTNKRLTVEQTKLRQDEEIPAFQLEIIDGEQVTFYYDGEIVTEKKDKKQDFKDAIVALLEKEDIEMSRVDIFRSLKDLDIGGEQTFDKALKEMVGKKKLFTRKGAGNRILHSLKPYEDS